MLKIAGDSQLEDDSLSHSRSKQEKKLVNLCSNSLFCVFTHARTCVKGSCGFLLEQ